ncbi:MAG: ABC transporter transmembrane domain-containing protein [Phycisphaerae bacterium]
MAEMKDDNSGSPEELDIIPDDLRQRLEQDISLQQVELCAPIDLDNQGRYIEGQLILTGDAIGRYVRRGGEWKGDWLELAETDDTKVVEGLGVNLLRLFSDGRLVIEYRFTLRHARQVARLQRRLEQLLTGRDGDTEPAEAPRGDEKKVRCDKCGRVIPAWSEFCPTCMSRRKILFRVMDFVKPYKRRAFAGAMLAIAGVALALFQPYLAKPMVDEGLGGTSGTQPDWPLFVTYVLLLGVLVFASALVRGIQSRLMAGLGSRVARGVRDTVYQHLHKLSLSFFARKQTGQLVTRVTTDSDRLWDFVAFTVVELVVAVLTIVGVGVALFVIHWKLAAVVLLPVPVMIALMVFFHRRLHHFFRRIMHRWGQMTSVIADALPGVRVIKAFSQEKREIDRFQLKNRQVYDEEMSLISTWTVFGPLMMFCTQVGIILVWLLGGYWVIRDYYSTEPGRMTVGTLVAFVGFMGMFYRPIHMVAHMDRMLNRAAASAQRIFEILDTEPGIYSPSAATEADDLTGRIELRNVSFSYDGVRRVLKDVDLTIEPGQMVGLAGPSGGGKTTLVNLICRFYDVLSGQILIDGVDVRDYDLEHLRRRIGVVLQEPFLFHGTVAENIAYGNPDAGIEEILSAARAANAHDFIVGFPDGYDTLVGERGQTLSGGERQRISIARAILNNPRILILDEATSSVDTETEKLIQEALDRLIADRTTIAIAHRLSTLRKADRLVILEEGRIVEQGSHEELAGAEDGLYAKLLKMQTETQSVIALS